MYGSEAVFGGAAVLPWVVASVYCMARDDRDAARIEVGNDSYVIPYPVAGPIVIDGVTEAAVVDARYVVASPAVEQPAVLGCNVHPCRASGLSWGNQAAVARSIRGAVPR